MLGDILVIVGIVLAIIDAIIAYPTTANRPVHRWLLNVAVVLIGLGVLVGASTLIEVKG